MEIWRYDIKPPKREKHEVVVSMQKDAQLLHVETKDGQPCLWALVDPKQGKVDRDLLIFGTGHDVPLFHGKYVGTFQVKEGETLVFHVFDRGEG